MNRASILIFQSFNSKNNNYTFKYLIDDTPYEITLKHSIETSLEESKKNSVLFNLGMCYTLDLAELTLPKKVVINFNLSELQLHFWKTIYQEVTKEKLYRDKLDLSLLENDWASNNTKPGYDKFSLKNNSSPVMLCLTGGKESLTLLKLLKGKFDLLLFFLNPENKAYRNKVFDRVKDEFPTVKTESNRFLIIKELEKKYGSRLASGVDMFHLTLHGLLLNTKYVLIGNEYSANFPNATYQGFQINHQYVKTIYFSKKVNWYIENFITNDFKYYSPFFGLYEYKIAERLFDNKDYLEVWTSCNRSTDEINFCCNCHKCAFTYLIGLVYTSQDYLKNYFSRDLLEDVELFRPLVDFTGEKPLDCVGDKEEVWVALNELSKRYAFKDKAVIKYFKQFIYPNIEKDLADFKQQVSSIQKVPQTLPKELQEIIDQAYL